MNTVSMETLSSNTVITEDTKDVVTMEATDHNLDVLQILHLIIASSGIITNLIVVVVFLKDEKLRRKAPNICIINQVGSNIFLTHNRVFAISYIRFSLILQPPGKSLEK